MTPPSALSAAAFRPAASRCEFLRGHAHNVALLQREETRVAQLRRCDLRRCDKEIERPARMKDDRPGRRRRQFCVRSGELFGDGCIRQRSRCIHTQRQNERRLFGNAHFLAHEPGRIGFQIHDPAGYGICPCRDVHKQPRLAFIAVIHQRAGRDALGVRPLNGSCLPAGRQSPLNLRGLARFARIDPIGVPAFANILDQRKRDRLTRRDLALLRHEKRPDLRRAVDLRKSGPRQEGCNQNGNERESGTFHGAAISPLSLRRQPGAAKRLRLSRGCECGFRVAALPFPEKHHGQNQ